MIRDSFIGPLYTLHVDDIGARHAVRVKCLCGTGPWDLHGFWLRQRYSSSEFLRRIVEGLKCPACRSRNTMAWDIVEAHVTQ